MRVRSRALASVAVLALAAGNAYAEEPAAVTAPAPAPEATPRPAVISPMGAAWRSALVPGWGQRYKEERGKGWAITGAAGGLAAATAGTFVWQTRARAAYLRLGEEDSADVYDARAKQQLDSALAFQVAAGATAVTWLYGVLDSGFSPVEPIRIKEAHVEEVFPAGAKYFEANPLAVISVENRSASDLTNVRASLVAPELFAAPIESGDVAKLATGASRGFALQAAFGDQLHAAARGDEREIPAQLVVEYEIGSKKRRVVRTASLHLFGRNAIVWDDMRRLGSFVTPRDPAVLAFVSAAVRTPAKPLSPSESVATAAALFDAMGALGIRYLTDPTTPYADIRGNVTGVDSVNFPRETLDRRTGDCDDLSALYASLLEGAGLHAALVDVPGHVFVLFDTGETLEEVTARTGLESALFEVRNGTAWLPVEVTSVGKPFDTAVRSASAEVVKWRALQKLAYFEVGAAQQVYPPSPPPFAAVEKGFPALDGSLWTQIAGKDAEIAAGRALQSRDAMIARVKDRKLAPASEANEIGVIHARLGDLDQALASFERAIAIDAKLAKAWNNVGNVHYSRGQNAKALEAYGRALEIAADSPRVLLNLALIHYESGDASKAAAYFTRALDFEPYFSAAYPELAALVRTGATVASAKPTVAERGAVTDPDLRTRWIP